MNSLLNTDKFTKTRTSPLTGKTQREWIQYADGMFEPVRKDGNLNKKYHADRRKFDWWAVEKPLDWQPSDEGKKATLNHDYRRPTNQDKSKTGPTGLAKPGNASKNRTTHELRDKDIGKGLSARLAEKDGTKPDKRPTAKPAPKTTLLRGAEAYHEFETERAAAKEAAKKNNTPAPRNSSQDAADLKKKEQEQSGASKAAGAGALAGMAKSKGQRGQGPATGDDKVIQDFKKDYEATAPKDRPKKKRKFEKKIKELRKKSKNAKGKEKKALQERAKKWKGALKVITDGKVRSGGPLMLFNVPLLEKLMNNHFTDPTNPDKT